MLYEGPERRSQPRRIDDLTEGEILELRKIIESERRMRWLWATMRNAAVWVVAIVTGVTVGYQAVTDLIKSMVGLK